MERKGVPFWKASACGNDFLIIEGKLEPASMEDFTRKICDRNNGVGADGVEWVYPGDNSYEIRARLINADGSHAEISGNGTRCVAAWHVAHHQGNTVRVATDAGVKGCELTGREGMEFTFRTAMGVPEVSPAFSMPVLGKSVRGVPVSTGNPHFVIFVDEFPSEWRKIAAAIQADSVRFPQGVNVEFVQVRSAGEIVIRIFERGAGETMSSGTGSSASAAAAIVDRKLERGLKVHAPGGTQLVEWDSELFLSGPARLICRGEVFA